METRIFSILMANEIFAIDILEIREAFEFTHMTKVPQTSDMMNSVINLRGSVFPIIDLRLKFGMEKGETTVNTCMIIIETVIDEETIVIGALVDSVKRHRC
jgi:purine-binding chemotaxis protein CheW